MADEPRERRDTQVDVFPAGPPSEAVTEPSIVSASLAKLGEWRDGFEACLRVVIADRMFIGWSEADAKAYAEKIRSQASMVSP